MGEKPWAVHDGEQICGRDSEHPLPRGVEYEGIVRSWCVLSLVASVEETWTNCHCFRGQRKKVGLIPKSLQKPSRSAAGRGGAGANRWSAVNGVTVRIPPCGYKLWENIWTYAHYQHIHRIGFWWLRGCWTSDFEESQGGDSRLPTEKNMAEGFSSKARCRPCLKKKSVYLVSKLPFKAIFLVGSWQ